MKQTIFPYLIVGILSLWASGDEFQVNTHTSRDQADAEIAAAADGSFIVVWRSYGQDGSSNGIFAQRYDPNVCPVGEEFLINTTTAGNQSEPAVAINTSGFVVTWSGPGISDPNFEDIFAQWFDPNGMPIGDELQINSNMAGRQICPDVAINQKGECVIVWESLDFPEEGDRTICGQIFDSNGTEIGNELILSGDTSPSRYADVAMDPNGNFAVVWMWDKSTDSIMAGLFNADDSTRIEPFKVNTIEFHSITQPAIAMDSTGGFIVTWDGDPNLAAQDDIHARMFDPNGTALGEQFFVNSTTEQAQQNPHIAMNEQGEFVIVWDSRIDPNVYERDIFGQCFNSLGDPVGDEFQLNTWTEADQRYPTVAMGRDGCFLTVWQSENQDGSGFGIFGTIDFLMNPVDFNCN